MASVALMSPPNQKEPDILARASLLPKRKPIVHSVTTRARFLKPRPNVITSASNSSKESLPPPSEKLKADDDVSSQPMAAQSETIKRPVVPKRTATIPAPSRARFQRAKPNIGLLLNKSTKDLTEKKCVPMSDTTKTQESSDSNLEIPDVPNTESTSEEIYNNDCNSPVARSPQKFHHEGNDCPDDGHEGTKLSLNIEKVIDVACSFAESQDIPQPTVDLGSVCGKNQDFSSFKTIPKDNTIEFLTEKSSHSDVPGREPATEISYPCDTEMLLTSPIGTIEITPEKENPNTTVTNKSIEYPTLKSILNSPRKRTATKKVHERRKRVANLSGTPSRSEMTMVDLIYWNPSSSPMKEIKVATAVEDLILADDPPPSTEEPEDSNIGPKVIINDNGEIILDESSLFVRRKDCIDHSVAAIIENDNTTYSSFRNRTFKTWSPRETAKFYKALSLVGTDFALMENIFKEDGQITRTRRELKQKFKREEKSNSKLVHTAIYELQTYDINILDDDQNIELLDESELIDDAPKQSKRATTSGTKTPGKRGRKKKSEMEPIINENTSESIYDMAEESRETTDSSPNEDLQRIENGTEFNLELSTRPGRARKAKLLSDYVTDMDDISDTNDNEEETLPIKKKRRIQVQSEEDDAETEAINNNGSIVDEHHIFQEKVATAEEIYPYFTQETDDYITPAKKIQDLDEGNIILCEENDENLNAVESINQLCNSSQLKGEFSIIPPAEADSEQPGEQKIICTLDIENSNESNIVIDSEYPEEQKVICTLEIENPNENNMAIDSECHEEQKIICTLDIENPNESNMAIDSEYPEEQKVICSLDVENPNENNLAIDSSGVVDQSESKNSELICTTEIVSSTDADTTAISSDTPMTDNPLKLPDSETCNDVNDNILTDAAITEVVTSDQLPRRTRRKILPNFIRGSKRPPIQKKPVLPPRRTSFISFTPVEEIIQETNFEKPTKTYSKLIKLEEEQGDMPEYLETVQRSPMNISRKRSLSGPAKSPCTPDRNITRPNSTRSPLTNAPLNVFSFNSNTVPQSSLELPLNTSQTADLRTINMNPEDATDSPPVVFLTRTPNNSNMLHLFLYQKS